MYNQLILLFAVSIISGGGVLLLPKLSYKHFPILLAFGGSYLFSFMMVHVLPEYFSFVFSQNISMQLAGGYMLAGALVQLTIDYLSQGIAHSHHAPAGSGHHHNSMQVTDQSLGLVVALCVHALFDGLLLGMPSAQLHVHCAHSVAFGGLLLGIILHKIPATISLVSVLLHHGRKRSYILLALLCFSIATPLSWLASSYLSSNNTLSASWLIVGWGMATGNLGHIATTILSESNPDHKIDATKVGVSMLGVLVALLLVYQG